jgi:hypothetical protein
MPLLPNSWLIVLMTLLASALQRAARAENNISSVGLTDPALAMGAIPEESQKKYSEQYLESVVQSRINEGEPSGRSQSMRSLPLETCEN